MNVKRKATTSLANAVTSPTAKKLKQGSLTTFFGAPKGSKDVHTAPKPSFDKQAWINSLTPSQKELLKYIHLLLEFMLNYPIRLEIDTLHESWLAVLKDELTKPYFLKVS